MSDYDEPCPIINALIKDVGDLLYESSESNFWQMHVKGVYSGSSRMYFETETQALRCAGDLIIFELDAIREHPKYLEIMEMQLAPALRTARWRDAMELYNHMLEHFRERDNEHDLGIWVLPVSFSKIAGRR